MFGLLGFILIFVLIILVIGLAIIGNIVRSFLRLLGFGKPKQRKKETYTKADNSQYDNSSDDDNQYQSSNHNKPKGKIFGKDEGEYIDFEEVK